MIGATEAGLYRLGRALLDRGYAFTTGTPASHARVNARRGNTWASNLRGIFGWSRPFQQADIDADIFRLMDAAGVLQPFESGWRSRVRFSTLQGNLFVHSAFPTEQADAIFFGPDSYRFAHALQQYLHGAAGPIKRAADIGCGAGPGALLVAQAHPKGSVWAIDCNESALLATRVNARLARVDNVRTRRDNLLDGVSDYFDLIVANPPYLVDPLQRSYRHGGGPLGAGLSLAIIDAGLPRLARSGTLFLYTGTAIVEGADLFLSTVNERLADQNVNWRYHEIDPDVFGEELEREVYSDTERIATVVLTVTMD